ncbi:hypothetical protein DVJ77_17175 [Dyella tabacisoli]|uniref:Uncharacterized protein n=2 Tax=Dyella tabacisoli TaxID=2282381 RepID=A0A369UJ46_9GAMM|nr:hypothetical protein DVJ77_17175 [Dyella tabacisoli]
MVPNMQKYEEIGGERAGSLFKGTNVLRSIGDTMFNWLSNAYSMKGAAFNEEREARLVYLSPLMESMHRYRVRGSALIPYIPIPISTGTLSPILHVRKGPTNRTPLHVVKGFLQANGLEDVEVFESDATYIG